MALHVRKAGDNLYKSILSIHMNSGCQAWWRVPLPTEPPSRLLTFPFAVCCTDCERTDPSRSEREVKSMAGT